MSRDAWTSAVAGPTWWERTDPRLKLAWLAWVSALGVVVDRWPALAALALVALVPAAGVRWTARGWLAAVGLMGLGVWGTVVSQALFYAATPRTPWWTLVPPGSWAGWTWPGLVVWREGALYGLTQSLRLVAVGWTGLVVATSTSPERLLAGLARLRVPPAIGMVLAVALRFLPVLVEEWLLVRRAWRLRTRAARGGAGPRLAERLGHELALWEPVLAVSLRRARTLAAALTSRGFDPARPGTVYPLLAMSRFERSVLILLGVSLAALVTVKLVYWLYLAELFYHAPWRGLYGFAREYL